MLTDWISVEDSLPDNYQRVIVKTTNRNSYGYNGELIDIYAAFFVKGKTREEVAKTKSSCFADQVGNNLKPYAWEVSPFILFGQEVSHWMPIPE